MSLTRCAYHPDELVMEEILESEIIEKFQEEPKEMTGEEIDKEQGDPVDPDTKDDVYI